jgi:hypothetical protein
MLPQLHCALATAPWLQRIFENIVLVLQIKNLQLFTIGNQTEYVIL